MSAARILGKQLKELLNGNHERIFAGTFPISFESTQTKSPPRAGEGGQYA
jgi:hypothetical protein